MTDFAFYQRTDTGVEEVARLSGENFSGAKADMIEHLLRASGWDDGDDPRMNMRGSRLSVEMMEEEMVAMSFLADLPELELATIVAVRDDEALPTPMRSQAERDLLLVNSISRMTYSNGASVKAVLDSWMKGGERTVVYSGAVAFLVNTETGDRFPLVSKQERDYVNYALNRRRHVYQLIAYGEMDELIDPKAGAEKGYAAKHGHRGRKGMKRGGSLPKLTPDEIKIGFRLEPSDRKTFVVRTSEKYSPQGKFGSERVTIRKNGDAILKGNENHDNDFRPGGGWGDFAITHGFARREVAVYEVDKALGLNIVPPTYIIYDEEGIEDVKSMQVWVENSEVGAEVEIHERDLSHPDELGKMTMLDAIIGNPDRHEYNWLLQTDPKTGENHLKAIDNGLGIIYESTDASDYYSKTVDAMDGFIDLEGNPYLPIEYRERLATAIADGSLEKALNVAYEPTDKIHSQILIEAAMKRARDVNQHWNEYFRDTLEEE